MDKFLLQIAALNMNKVLGAALIATAAYWGMLYNDGSTIQGSISTISTELQAEEQKKNETDSILAQVKEMRDKIGSLSIKYEEIAKRLPEALDTIVVSKSIDSYARNAEVSVKSKKPAENKAGEVVEEVPVEVIVEGKYHELAKFAYLVGSNQRISRLKDIKISVANGEEADSKNFQLRLKLEGRVVGYKLTAPIQAEDPNDPNAQAPAEVQQ